MENKRPMVCIEHVECQEGNIERGERCYVAADCSYSEVLRVLSSELDGFEDYPDLMILISLEMMTEEEIDAMPEFQGW